MGSRGKLAERNFCASNTELMFRFWNWCADLGRIPLAEEIVSVFNTTPATAYRWRNAWCDANSLPLPKKRPPGTRPDRFNVEERERQRVRRKHHRESTKPGGNRHPQTIVQGT